MPFFSRITYLLLYTLFVLLFGPFYLLRTRARRQASIPWLERLGRVPDRLPTVACQNWRRIWIHAVSVGEVNLLRPLVRVLSQGQFKLFISTTTETGQALAQSLFARQATIFYFPLDFRRSCRRYLKRIRPHRILLVETEIWPNFIHEASSQKIPIAIINGRISDSSHSRYRLVRRFLKPLLCRIEHFCMQSRPDKNRILELGAPPDRVHLVGNLKFDYQLVPCAEKEGIAEWVSTWIGKGGDFPIWLCGSTHEGEESILTEAFLELRETFPKLRLILVPRHPHRGPEILAEARDRGLECLLRSQLESDQSTAPKAPDCLIVDSIGELAYLYACADVVFVGGSLVPTGGQNVIEAAHFSKPILFGPHMENFREITAHFLDSYAALQVASPAELVAKLTGLLEDPAARRWLGRNARKVVRDNHGALQRTLQILKIG